MGSHEAGWGVRFTMSYDNKSQTYRIAERTDISTSIVHRSYAV
jgi:hypothetical protein